MKYISAEVIELQKQLDSFLFENKKEIVINLQGYWGIGKTYFWHNYIKYKEQEDKHVYISLFGVNSIDEIKRKIILKVSDRAKIADKLKKITGIFKQFEIDISSVISIIDKDSFSKVIICFDDFERLSPNLSISEVLGFISELKEQYKCKIILISNNDVLKEQDILNHQKIIKRNNPEKNDLLEDQEQKHLLSLMGEEKKSRKTEEDRGRLIFTNTNNYEIYNKYIEKIVDVSFEYNPTLSDIINCVKDENKDKDFIDWKLIEIFFNQLKDNNKKFNIRLLKQLVLKLDTVSFILKKDIHQKIRNGVVLNIFRLVVKENINYRNFLQIPIVIPNEFNSFYISLVNKHYIDINMFKKKILLLNESLKKDDTKTKLYDEIQDTYYKYLYDLQYDNETFVKDFHKLLNTENVDIVELVSLPTLEFYISNFLKKLDPTQSKKYDDFFIEKSKLYIKKHISTLHNLDMFSKDSFNKVLENCDELEKYYKEQKVLSQKQNQTPESVKNTIIEIRKKSGWSKEIEEQLSKVDIEQHKIWLAEDRKYFETLFDFMSWIDGFTGEKPFKDVYNKTIEAYKELNNDEKYAFKMKFILERFKIGEKS